MLRNTALVFALIVAVCLVAGCSSTSVSTAITANTESSPIPEAEARELADAVVDDVLAEDTHALYKRMHQAFQASSPPDDLSLDILYEYGGRPVEAEYKMDEAGTVTSAEVSIPTRKFWYAVETDEHEMGEFFLFVEVIEEVEGLACSQFSIVRFADEVPLQLQ